MMVPRLLRPTPAPRRPLLNHARAIRALHLNYRWSGIWIWLRCSDVRIPGAPPRRGPGWALLLCCPFDVWTYQEAVADGVFF